MTGAGGAILQQDALERIIDAVCEADPRLVSAATKIDRSSFALDMKVCPFFFDSTTKLGSRATAKKRQQSLGRIKQYSTIMRDLLKIAYSDEWLRKELSLGLSLSEDWQPSTLISDIEASVGAGEILLGELLANLSALARAKPVYPVLINTGLSGFEVFAGVHLPYLFQRHFGGAATRKRNAHGSAAIEGGVIAFASAVMRELHITKRDGSAYADETISRAMTWARQKKPRRRAK